jgi:hypothetical protein
MAAKKVLMLCGDYMEDYEVSSSPPLFSRRLLLNYMCFGSRISPPETNRFWN